jgi:hypothetical protein
MDSILTGLAVLGSWLDLDHFTLTIALLALALAIVSVLRARQAEKRPGVAQSDSVLLASSRPHGQEAGALAARWEGRLMLLQHRIERLEGGQAQPAATPTQAVQSTTETASLEEPAPQPVPKPTVTRIEGVPVELKEGWVVGSESLSAPGVLVAPVAGGLAQVFINEDMDLSNIILENWSAVFDVGSGEPFRRYRTVRPAEIEWSGLAGRGRLVRRGQLEVVA